MDQPPLSSQINDLEQRYQAGQEKIAKLQQKVEAQTYELQEQNRRIEQLEKDLAQAHTRPAQEPPVEKQLARLREELLQLIEHHQNRPQPEFADSGRAVSAQLNTHTKALHELQREVDKAHRYNEQISLARTEMDRINKVVSTFQVHLESLEKQLAEQTQPITYLEEQRRTDARQLAELQAELPDLAQKIEANLSKIQMVEQQIPQFGKYELALEELRNEIRRFRERVDFQIAERERQMKNWSDLTQAQEDRLAEYKALMEKYAEHYQLNKRALASLQDFQERLQREQHQTEELQRLAEERQWASIEKWRIEYEQRWQKQSTEWKPQLVELERSLGNLQKQINEVIKFNQAFEKQIDMIVQIIEEDIQSRTLAAADWQKRFEELANGQS